MQLNAVLIRSTVVAALGGLLFGFDTVVISAKSGGTQLAVGHLLLEGFAATDPELYRRVAARDAQRQN